MKTFLIFLLLTISLPAFGQSIKKNADGSAQVFFKDGNSLKIPKGVGDYKESYTSSTAWSASGTWQDIATLTLEAGIWDVQGTILWSGAGTTLSGGVLDLEVGVGTTSGASGAGVVMGITGSITYLQTMSGSGSLAITTPTVRVRSDGRNLYYHTNTISSSQVIRLKGLAGTHSGATPQYLGFFRAVRAG